MRERPSSNLQEAPTDVIPPVTIQEQAQEQAQGLIASLRAHREALTLIPADPTTDAGALQHQVRMTLTAHELFAELEASGLDLDTTSVAGSAGDTLGSVVGSETVVYTAPVDPTPPPLPATDDNSFAGPFAPPTGIGGYIPVALDEEADFDVGGS